MGRGLHAAAVGCVRKWITFRSYFCYYFVSSLPRSFFSFFFLFLFARWFVLLFPWMREWVGNVVPFHFKNIINHVMRWAFPQLFRVWIMWIVSTAPPPTMATLTSEQRKEIQKTWSIPAASPTESGAAILYAFFEKYPKNLDKFHAFKATPFPALKVRRIHFREWESEDDANKPHSMSPFAVDWIQSAFTCIFLIVFGFWRNQLASVRTLAESSPCSMRPFPP